MCRWPYVQEKDTYFFAISIICRVLMVRLNMEHCYCYEAKMFNEYDDFYLPHLISSVLTFRSVVCLGAHKSHLWSVFWIRLGQTCPGKSAAGADLRFAQRPLTSLGTSAWPYRVTTQYSYHMHMHYASIADSCCVVNLDVMALKYLRM